MPGCDLFSCYLWLLLEFCAGHGLSIMKTILEHMVVHNVYLVKEYLGLKIDVLVWGKWISL